MQIIWQKQTIEIVLIQYGKALNGIGINKRPTVNFYTGTGVLIKHGSSIIV